MRALLSGIIVIALFGGCAAEESLGEFSPDASSGTCMVAVDCPSPQLCVAGRCVPQVADASLDGTFDGTFDATGLDGATDVTGLDATLPPTDGTVTPGDGTVTPLDGPTCALARGTPGRLPVDIIVMVDQSASTGEEAAAIQANINTSLGNVLAASGLDYRVILINSDTSRLCPAAPLGDPARCGEHNPPRYYRVLHPINNSDELTLLLWTYDGASKTPNSCHRRAGTVPAWRDFVRFDSLKIFIVFSDDDPTTYSRGSAPAACPARGGGGPFAGCTNADCLSVTGTSDTCGTLCPNFGCPTFADRAADWGGGDFPTELYRLGPQRMVRGQMEGPFGSRANPRWVFHSLIGLSRTLEPAAPLTDRCDLCASDGNTSENAGVTYQQLSRMTGGVRFSSCNTDYSPVFRRIASMLGPVACEFRLEPTGLGAVDPARTNVVYFRGGGSAAETIPRDDTAACDVGANGWQFVADRTRIRICGSACSRIQSDPAARVEIQVGCATVQCPPSCADAGGPDSGTVGVHGDGGADGGGDRDGGARDAGCVPEICGNGVDDDCDGLADQLDRDCILVPP